MTMIMSTYANSQIQLDSINVAVEKMREFAKYVDFKHEVADPQLKSLKIQVKELDSAYQAANRRLFNLKYVAIPKKDSIIVDLKSKNNLFKQQIESDKLYHEAELKNKRKGNFWAGLGIGGAIVALLSLFVGG